MEYFFDSGIEYNISLKGKDYSDILGVIAEDEYGAQSEWVYVLLKEKSIIIPFFLQKFFQRFPIFEKILNQYFN